MVEDKRSIVCFSINEWGDVPRNQVHLMRVARERGHRILYVETVGLRRPELTTRDARKIFRRARRMLRPLRCVRDGFWVLSPIAVPIHGNPVVDRLNRYVLGAQLRLACRLLQFAHPILWSYLPQGISLKSSVKPSATLYFRCDEYTAFRGVDPRQIERLERDAVAHADLCLASARHYLDGPLKNASHALWVPNAVDLDHYEERPWSDPYGGMTRPVLLMMGTLEYWLDTDLLAAVARRRPSWTIVLAGPLRIDLTPFADVPNVKYVGVVAYERLPDFIAGADACLIPFRHTAVSDGASPGKMFQYLAGGRPVVSTRVLDPADFGDFVYFADSDPEDFVRVVERAIADDTPQRRASRRLKMKEHTWDRRFDVIEAALAEMHAGPPPQEQS